VAAAVPLVGVPLQIGVHLGLESDGGHPLGTATADLIQGEGGLLVSALLCDYPELGVPPLAGVTTPADSDQ